jgi:hypothetical protein
MNVRTMKLRTPITHLLAIATCLSLAAVLGCSNSVSPDATNIIAATADVPVMITDDPADQLVSFSLTLNSIVLTDSAGKTASILTTPTTVEICHLNGIQAPLITAKIPQDTYVSALITYSNPQITFIDSPSKTPVVAAPILLNTSYTFNFSTPFTVSNTSTSLLVDLLAGQSVSIAGTTVSVKPVFSIKAVPPASALPPVGKNGTGQEQKGTVVSASGTTLIVQPYSGANITFTTNSATVYQGVGSLTALTAGELVEVDFTVQTGSVLLATRVELEPLPPGGAPQSQLGGTVTTAPAGNSFQMTLVQGLGKGLSPTSIGALYTVTYTGSTAFSSTPQFVSIANLPFLPTFTAATLKPGQVIDVTASSITGTTAAASNIVLDPQTLSGTVTAISTSGAWQVYTLTLPSGSAFGTLSGATKVTVYASSIATASPVAKTPIAIGASVRFNGLVFYNNGGFAMIAGVCPDAGI